MSKFGWATTADEVLSGLNLDGMRVFITGVSAGLGLETARALLTHGVEVVGAARDLSKAAAATATLREEFGNSLQLVELDLTSLASVGACADALVAAGRPLDVLIANAGIMATPESRTQDGFELQFGTNHLGHFLLVNRIASLVPPGGRIVVLASSAHQFSPVDLDDANYEKRPYDPFDAYGASKTANILFAVELDRRHRPRNVRATAVHPGSIKTDLLRHMSDDLISRMSARSLAEKGDGVTQLQLKSVAQGAATTVWAGFVAAPDEVGARYCEDCGVAETAEKGGKGVRPYAVDPQIAHEVWAMSERMVGEEFPVVP